MGKNANKNVRLEKSMTVSFHKIRAVRLGSPEMFFGLCENYAVLCGDFFADGIAVICGHVSGDIHVSDATFGNFFLNFACSCEGSACGVFAKKSE